MNRRQSLRQLSLLGSPFVFSSCAQVANMGRLALQSNYLVDSKSMLARMIPYFPFNRDYSGIGQVSLSNPDISMIPEQNKIRLGLAANAGLANSLGQNTGLDFLRDLGGQTTSGNCQLACGLRFNSENNSIYLKDPVIEQVNLSGLAGNYTEPARNLLNLVGPQILDRHPIHTLQPSFATQVLRNLTVQKEGLLLDFGI